MNFLSSTLLYTNIIISFWPGIFIVLLVFSKFWHGIRKPYEVVPDRGGFSVKRVFAPKFGKMDQKWAKSSLLKDLVVNCYWSCSIMKTYWLCSHTNLIFGKMFVPDICSKMFSANQIAGLFNQLYLQNKSVK